MKEGNISDIYIQNPNFFDKYRDEIKAWFGTNIKPLPYIALHLRRGGNPSNPNEPNYSENTFYVNLADNTDYYEEALDYFPKEEILIFSDDVVYAEKWAQAIVRDNFWVIDPSTDAVEVLNRMAGCKGIIMANSSLSWWGAYLGSGDKKIIAPSAKHWYNSGQELTVCPDHWIRI